MACFVKLWHIRYTFPYTTSYHLLKMMPQTSLFLYLKKGENSSRNPSHPRSIKALHRNAASLPICACRITQTLHCSAVLVSPLFSIEPQWQWQQMAHNLTTGIYCILPKGSAARRTREWMCEGLCEAVAVWERYTQKKKTLNNWKLWVFLQVLLLLLLTE